MKPNRVGAVPLVEPARARSFFWNTQNVEAVGPRRFGVVEQRALPMPPL